MSESRQVAWNLTPSLWPQEIHGSAFANLSHVNKFEDLLDKTLELLFLRNPSERYILSANTLFKDMETKAQRRPQKHS